MAEGNFQIDENYREAPKVFDYEAELISGLYLKTPIASSEAII